MKKIIAAAAVFALPAFVSAAEQISNIDKLFERVTSILNAVIPIIISLAVVYLIWAVFRYVIAGGDEEKKEKAKSLIGWGILGLFVMLSIWGLVRILVNTLNLDNKVRSEDIPSVIDINRGRNIPGLK